MHFMCEMSEGESRPWENKLMLDNVTRASIMNSEPSPCTPSYQTERLLACVGASIFKKIWEETSYEVEQLYLRH